MELEWDSIYGRTYFIQISEDLENWSFAPIIELGDGDPLSCGLSSTGTRFFVRLKYTDQGTNNPDNEDFDNDGVKSQHEIEFLQTDPLVYSTDGSGVADGRGDSDLDGIPDYWELHYFNSLAATASSDSDNDGYSNFVEWQNKTNPTHAENPLDADRDLLPNTYELAHGLDPFDSFDFFQDKDQDGLSNGTEFLAGLAPVDRDKILVFDTPIPYNNAVLELNPSHSPTVADPDDDDADGMRNDWERFYGFDPLNASDATQDTDSDGLNNLAEFTHRLDPRSADTDGDGINDLAEIISNLDPAQSELLSADWDYDGLTNEEEAAAQTNGAAFDTDVDGYGDLEELVALTSALSSTSHPAGPSTAPPPQRPVAPAPAAAGAWQIEADVKSIESHICLVRRTGSPGGSYQLTNGDGWAAQRNFSKFLQPAGVTKALEKFPYANLAVTSDSFTLRSIYQSWDTEIFGGYTWEHASQSMVKLKVRRHSADTALAEVHHFIRVDQSIDLKGFPNYRTSQISMPPDDDERWTSISAAVVDITIPAGATESPEVEVKCPCESNKAFKVLLVPFQLMRAPAVSQPPLVYQPVRGQQAKALPGMQINLKGASQGTVPLGFTTGDLKWTVPGKIFKDYLPTNATATLVQHTPAEMEARALTFYWADAGEKTLQLKLNVMGTFPVTINHKIHVDQPVCTLVTDSNGAVGFNAGQTRFGLRGDTPALEIAAFVTLKGSVALPAGWNEGTWHFTQLITSQRFREMTNGDKEKTDKNGVKMLDTEFVYSPPGIPGSPLPGFLSNGTDHTMTDNPSTPTSGTKSIRFDDEKFETYILFKPMGVNSKYVPLKKIEWSIKAKASLNQTSSPPAWELVPGYGSVHPTISASAICIDHPEWNQNINIPPAGWVPEN